MARKGLPKRYAKMGFKKGWKAYKASKSNPKRGKTTKTKSRGGKVARKKRSYRRRTTRFLGMNMPTIVSAAAGYLGFGSQYGSYMPLVAGAGVVMRNSMLRDVGLGFVIGQAVRNLTGNMFGNSGGTQFLR